MVNFILTLILIGITFFVLNLFPFFQDWTSDIRNNINEKKNNVVEEYDRVKDEIGDISEKVEDTKETVENTIETVGNAVDTAGNLIDKVDGVLGGTPEDIPLDDIPLDEANDEVSEAMPTGRQAGENDSTKE